MAIFKKKDWRRKLFSAPKQGIDPNGENTVNRYVNDPKYIDERLVKSYASCYIGKDNKQIGKDIGDVRYSLFDRCPEDYRYSKNRYNFEMPILKIYERTGYNRQYDSGKYTLPTPEEYIANVDSLFEEGRRDKRIFRLDILDSDATKAKTNPEFSNFLGTDSGEVKTSKASILGEDALISVPKDTGFNRYADYINGGDVKVKSNDKKIRKLLKKNHRLVNALDRDTLGFMYGFKNPHIEQIMRNAKIIK